uniref:Uncharacterized protein n=1 Tax=Cacopsylla melanoneura TaxID=428564 RepID=A0A8D8ZRA4_9HEMI
MESCTLQDLHLLLNKVVESAASANLMMSATVLFYYSRCLQILKSKFGYGNDDIGRSSRSSRTVQRSNPHNERTCTDSPPPWSCPFERPPSPSPPTGQTERRPPGQHESPSELHTPPTVQPPSPATSTAASTTAT